MSNLKVANTSYPTNLDTATLIAPGTDEIVAAHINGPVSAILALETELGIGLKGTAASLVARLASNMAADGGIFRASTIPVSPVTTVTHLLWVTSTTRLYLWDVIGAQYKRVDSTNIHADLSGLLAPADDHTQYVHNTIARTISANHTFSGTLHGSPIFDGNPTFSASPIFSATPLFSGTAHFSGNPLFDGNPTFSSTPSFTQPIGVSPFLVTSTTVVANLNAALLNGAAGSQYARLDAASNFTVTPQINGNNIITAATVLSFPSMLQNVAFAATVAMSNLTFALKGIDGNDPSAGNALSITFRDSSLTSGVYHIRTVQAATSVVLTAGSSLGFAGLQSDRIYLWAIDNAGTVELAVSRYADVFWDDNLVTTVAEGGGGGATSPYTMYSTTARTNVACRLLGYVVIQSAVTPGIWSTAPSLKTLAFPGITRERQVQTTVTPWLGTPTATRAIGTVYQNLTGRKLFVQVYASFAGGSFAGLGGLTDASATPTTTVYGSAISTSSLSSNHTASMIVEPNNYYVVVWASSAGVLQTWTETVL